MEEKAFKKWEDECELCNGTGIVPINYLNSDGNWEVGAGSMKCICKHNQEDEVRDR